ncbi:amino acid aminotransferase [Sphingomonas canadensis]|uniref:Amino acid aminotransferase n=1 Tax=Sphingomonas canadensis TaxID=1219257 RepID=A0ABW3HAS9_9SPHN|nr:amino acid aminotransferase [Sphingomonas canadensis]MCW3838097.1 aspartate/tyrosine/aromatic aminotransferase [Sphingomonas canadensis]
MAETALIAAPVLDGLPQQPADPLLALIGMFRADPRPDKIDLGVGVFRDDGGATPVLDAVKHAEELLLARQDSKSYLGADGDRGFVALLEPIVFGADAANPLRTGVQTPGGTGALRLGMDLLARARPDMAIWIGEPSWANHVPTAAAAQLTVRRHRFFDQVSQRLEIDAMLAGLAQARPGDALLLHGCGHNPSGATVHAADWLRIAAFVRERGLIPFVDLAYQGLAHGLEEDAAGLRILLEAAPEALVAYSCDKNFGMYRDRVGALWVQATDGDALARARSNMLSLARTFWSMPPDHGAAVVRLVLSDPLLRASWEAELAGMRDRIAGLRRAVAATEPRLAALAEQTGMFSLLPVSAAAVTALREEHGIYMAGDARINVAGLRLEDVPRFVAAVGRWLG